MTSNLLITFVTGFVCGVIGYLRGYKDGKSGK